MYVTKCIRCGETFNLNVLTGECFRCGVNKLNDPVASDYIKDIKLTSDLKLLGQIYSNEIIVQIITNEGDIVARGWDNVSTI